MKKCLLLISFIFLFSYSNLFGIEINKYIEKIESSDTFASYPYKINLKNYKEVDGITFFTYVDNSNFIQTKVLENLIFYFNDNQIHEILSYEIPENTDSNLYKQIKYVSKLGNTTFLADFDYDYCMEYFYFNEVDLNCGINFGELNEDYAFLIDGNYCSHTDIFYNKKYKDIIYEYFWKGYDFCIINGKRGIRIKVYNSKNDYVFFYWSKDKCKYILDESLVNDQLKGAYCPSDYFAYNGLKFSKLNSKLNDEDLKDLDKAQLRLFRNAIYARHGRTFKSEDLQSLWECYNWYEKNPNYSDDLLTEVDKYNIELIQKYEK